MIKHPSESNLALFAGGELGSLRRWSVERHVAACSECQREVSEFSALRDEAAELSELPEVSWGNLTAEMKAQYSAWIGSRGVRDAAFFAAHRFTRGRWRRV